MLASRRWQVSFPWRIEVQEYVFIGILGAQNVIKQILARRTVTKLVLGHNDLGDAGCEELFGFLSSDTGRNYRISQISLNSNGIGNRGLLAISRYLRDNVTLKELFLQNVSLSSASFFSIHPVLLSPGPRCP